MKSKEFLKQCITVLFLSCLFCSTVSCTTKDNQKNTDFEEDSKLKILSFSPQEELPTAVKYPSIQVQFSEPIVAIEKLGIPTDKSEIMTINPPLNGTFRWYGTSLLSFECSDSLIPQKEYTVTINKSLKSINGNKLSGKNVFKFYTEELKINSIIPGISGIEQNQIFPYDEIPTEYANEIAIYFSNNVNPKVIKSFLYFENDATKNKLDYSIIEANNNSIRVKLSGTLQDNMKINCVLPKGTMADENCRATTKDQIKSFETLKDLRITRIESDLSSWGKFSNPVRVVFNHTLLENSKSQIASLITTEPQMPVTEENIHISGAALLIYNLPVEYNFDYKINIKAGIKDIYNRTTHEDTTIDVHVGEAQSFVRFKDYGFKLLEAQFSPKLVFEYQNILPNSSYLVQSLRDITNGAITSKQMLKTFDEKSIPKNKRVIEVIDLSPYLENINGQLKGTIALYSKIFYKQKVRDWQSQKYIEKEFSENNEQFIQVTDLGISVRYGYNKVVALVSKLSTGEPIQNATVMPVFFERYNSEEILSQDFKNIFERRAKTNENGLAIINYPEGELVNRLKNSTLYIVVTTEDDQVIFNPYGNYVYSSNWNRGSINKAEKEQPATFIFTDRGLYKPGETITFRGIDRTLKLGKYSSFTGNYTIELTDQHWRPTVFATTSGTTSQNGTFWGQLKLPEDFEPGSYMIKYYRNNNKNNDYSSCAVQVQFFERLRFESSATIPQITYYSGDKITAEIQANYLGGGSLAGATYSTDWTREPIGFSAKNQKYKDLRFGPIIGYDGRNWLNSENNSLSADGKGSAEQKTGDEKIKGMAYSYAVQANITDAGNQRISTSARTIVHPAKFYIGLSNIKNINGFAKKGDTLNFEYICLNPEENIPNPNTVIFDKTKLKIELIHEEWKQIQQIGINGEINTRYQREMVTEEETEELLKIGNFNPISVKPKNGGAYLLRLSTTDKNGKDVITETRFYVTSSDFTWFNRESSEKIEFQTDKQLYEIGETAQILINSPIPKGTYLLTIEREGIISEKIIKLDTSSTVLEVPIEESYIPVVYVTLTSYTVRNGQPKHDFNTPDLDKPKGLFGYIPLHINTTEKQFDIKIEKAKTNYRPGEDAEITITATKHGKPVSNAEITLLAVDRGVIDLINYHVPNPIKFFYNEDKFLNCILGGDSRSLLIDPVTYEVRNQFGGDSLLKSAASKIQERKDFNPTALFIPELITDENGKATAKFKLPDTLTAYRVTAVGVNENSFAISEDEMPVTNPISVREVLPRKLRLNDNAELGVVITNMTEETQNVTVTMNISSGLEKTGYIPQDDEIIKIPGDARILGSIEKQISVPANKTLPLMFMMKANAPGWVTAEYTITSSIINERIFKGLEIEKPYIFETVTTVGEIQNTSENNQDIAQEQIVIPENTEDGLGNITIQLDPTRLGTLKESINYVFRYPYGCLEQRSARVLPLVAFGKYMKIFGLKNEVISPESVARKEINSWQKSQLQNGGFPYWPNGQQPSLFVSMRIAEIIALAKEKNILSSTKIDTEKLADYIEKELSKIYNDSVDSQYLPYTFSYGNYVLQRLGRNVPENSVDFILKNEYSDINDYAFAGLITLQQGNTEKANEIAKKMKRYMSFTTRGIDITSTQGTYNNWNFLNDTSENYALSLMFFTKLNPEANLKHTSHIVYQLLQMQNASNGYWKSTAATTRVLIALDEYIRTNNLEGTNFTSEVSINNSLFMKEKFKGLNAKPVEKTESFTDSFVKALPKGTRIPVVINKSGTGNLYYTLSMKYALPPQEQIARDEGICIYTEIFDTQTNELVTTNNLDSDKIYKKVVHISSTKDRQYVALRVPIPAGAEVMNAAFTTTGTIPNQENETSQNKYSYYYNYGKLSNQEIYDCEVQYFWDMFIKGTQKIEFYFRPVRKGIYNTPAIQAECMYEPEIFGRTKGNVWTIK